jgi:hypothetical protein
LVRVGLTPGCGDRRHLTDLSGTRPARRDEMIGVTQRTTDSYAPFYPRLLAQWLRRSCLCSADIAGSSRKILANRA